MSICNIYIYMYIFGEIFKAQAGRSMYTSWLQALHNGKHIIYSAFKSFTLLFGSDLPLHTLPCVGDSGTAMLILAAASGALSVGLLWLVVACSWPKLAIVKLVIMAMHPKERCEIYRFLECVEPSLAKCGEEDCQSTISSQWTKVSEAGSPVGKSPVEKTFSAAAAASVDCCPVVVCNHHRTTTKGSNHFQARERCLDCGKLLSVIPKDVETA